VQKRERAALFGEKAVVGGFSFLVGRCLVRGGEVVGEWSSNA